MQNADIHENDKGSRSIQTGKACVKHVYNTEEHENKKKKSEVLI
jgi:hypothetical protein